MKDFLTVVLAVIIAIILVLGGFLILSALEGCFIWCILAIISSLFELEVVPFGVVWFVVAIISLVKTTFKVNVNTDKENK